MPNSYQDKIMNDIHDMFSSKTYLLRTKSTIEFEEKLCTIFNTDFAIAVNSGTSAIHCSLIACGIEEGDEVIVPALSLVMTIAPILYLKAIPIFVDCKINKIDFDENDLLKKISKKTKAIIPVHMWGYSYNMSFLKEIVRDKNIYIIEDACQAHGSKWKDKYLGTIGNLGCFSMKDGKIISTGEGGFILTNDKNLADKCRLLRTHNFNINNPSMSYQELGYNYRLTEYQAIIAIRQFEIFDKLLEQRKFFFQYLFQMLEEIPNLSFYKPYTEESPNFYSPLILTSKGNEISKELSMKGVINSVGSFGLCPVNKRKFLSYYSQEEFTNTRNFLNQTIALFLLPTYSIEQLELTKDIIIDTVLNNYNK